MVVTSTTTVTYDMIDAVEDLRHDEAREEEGEKSKLPTTSADGVNTVATSATAVAYVVFPWRSSFAVKT